MQVAQGEQRRVAAENERLRQMEIERARPQPCTVPLGDPPRGQKFGEGLIALSVNLGPFIPPALRRKSRFMNLAATLHWATALLWHLWHFDSQSRSGTAAKRFQGQFGWLRGFAICLPDWMACQAVMGRALTFSGQAGIYTLLLALPTLILGAISFDIPLLYFPPKVIYEF